jgi:ketosteroid isomerase-like protein
MRNRFVFILAAGLSCFACAQQPAAPTQFGQGPPAKITATSTQQEVFQAKIKEEWEAIKNKDKKAYGELLAEDYQGVEVDGRGERNKLQAINEMPESNVFDYTLWGFKLIPLEPKAAFVIYESTIQFPPKSQVRYSRIYITELWVKRGDQWKILHYQETHVK